MPALALDVFFGIMKLKSKFPGLLIHKSMSNDLNKQSK